jgi:hypothetical protein
MDVALQPSQLSDDELLDRVEQLAARARDATTGLLPELMELETRGLHLRAGYGTLFSYCRDALGLAEYSAFNRIEAARAARKFPVILDRLRAGEVHLATVRMLGPYLTADNHEDVLARARGKTKAQVEQIVAELLPKPDARAFIRKLPATTPPPEWQPPPPLTWRPSAPSAPAARPVAPPPSAPTSTVAPLAPDRHRLQATLDAETIGLLELAQDLLRHAIPTGDIAAVVARALRVLVTHLLKEKFAVTSQPRGGRLTDPDSRHIPADVKRTVFLRDLGRCAYVGTLGRRCGTRSFLEFHHVKPYMAGGEATEENIQLRCRAHNQYEGRTFFRREEEPAPPARDPG